MDYSDILRMVEKYAQSPENIDVGGIVNWNFVEADIYLDSKEEDIPENFLEMFEDAVGEYEFKMRLGNPNWGWMHDD